MRRHLTASYVTLAGPGKESWRAGSGPHQDLEWSLRVQGMPA